ncbi:MAG: hypothetical protein AAFV53_31735 [Myxococcota bacterium]
MGELDPDRFFRLHPAVQRNHLEHTRNWLNGRYNPPQRSRRPAMATSPAHGAAHNQALQHIAEQRNKTRRR